MGGCTETIERNMNGGAIGVGDVGTSMWGGCTRTIERKMNGGAIGVGVPGMPMWEGATGPSSGI